VAGVHSPLEVEVLEEDLVALVEEVLAVVVPVEVGKI
jgi:hypothetical protein